MSIMFAALNPNLNNEQLLRLAEHDTQCKIRVIETFGECLGKMKTDEEKLNFLQACIPALAQILFF